MLKILYTGLSPTISSQFTVEMCAATKNCKKKFTKTIFFWRGGLRSFNVINVNKSKKRVTSACYNMQHVCAYLQHFSRYARLLR